MIDICVTMMLQLFEILPILIVMYYVFDFLGSFLFGRD